MNSDSGGVLVQAKTHRQGWKLDLQCKCLVCDKRAPSLCGVCTGHCDFRLCVLNIEWILSNFRLISMPTSYCKTKFCLEELFWGMFAFGTNVHVVVPHKMLSSGPSSIKSLILHKVQRIMFLLTIFAVSDTQCGWILWWRDNTWRVPKPPSIRCTLDRSSYTMDMQWIMNRYIRSNKVQVNEWCVMLA